MKKRTGTCLIALLLWTATFRVQAQMPDSVARYIDSALHFMQAKSLYGKNLDWKSIRDTALMQAKEAGNYREAFPAIAYAFRQLKDYHGMVANPDTFYRYPPPVNFAEVLSESIKKEFAKGPKIATAALGSVAYLRVPSMNVTKQEDMDKRANSLRDSLCLLLSRNPAGLVIDLRMNSGGNSAPMLSGLGPVFRSDLLGYGVDRDDRLLEPVRLKDGVVLDEKGNRMVAVQNTCTMNPHMPIAALIGSSTLSSGEILAAFLKQQPNVRLFGEHTPGFCNATEGFLFANNQGYLLLSVNRIADATKQVYREGFVRPHVWIRAGDNFENIAADPTVQAALRWLSEGKKRK